MLIYLSNRAFHRVSTTAFFLNILIYEMFLLLQNLNESSHLCRFDFQIGFIFLEIISSVWILVFLCLVVLRKCIILALTLNN